MTGGDVISTDDIAGVKVQRVKVQYGSDGSATDVAAGTPLPVTVISGTIAAMTDKTQFTKLTDGTDTALVTAAGEVNVLATAQPGTDIGDVTINNAAGASAVNIQDGGNSITVDGSVSITSNSSVNVAQVAGTTTDTNSGNKSAGTLRVVLATDQPALTNKLLVTPDSVALPANQSVNVSQINAVTPLMGNGATGTGSQRVTIASDNSAVSGLGVGATGSAVPANAVLTGLTDTTNTVAAKAIAHGMNTTAGVMAAGMVLEFDDTSPTAITENQFGTARGSANRNLYTTLRDAAGNERGVNVTAGNALVVDGSASTQPVSQATASNLNAQVVGNAADAAADSGNPVKVAGIYQSTLPTYTDGQRANVHLGTRGAVLTQIMGADSTTGVATSTGPADASSNTANTLSVNNYARVYNGTNWDRMRGDTNGSYVGGNIAHDGADAGNPVKVGAKAISSLKTATMVSSADRTDAQSDLDGAILTRAQFPLGDLLSERVTDTGGTSTAFTNFSAVASTRNYVTAITVNNSSATAGTVDFRDGTGGSVLWTMPIPAGGGSVLPAGAMPYFRTTANTALAYDVSGALTTVTISVSGFQSKV